MWNTRCPSKPFRMFRFLYFQPVVASCHSDSAFFSHRNNSLAEASRPAPVQKILKSLLDRPLNQKLRLSSNLLFSRPLVPHVTNLATPMSLISHFTTRKKTTHGDDFAVFRRVLMFQCEIFQDPSEFPDDPLGGRETPVGHRCAKPLMHSLGFLVPVPRRAAGKALLQPSGLTDGENRGSFFCVSLETKFSR